MANDKTLVHNLGDEPLEHNGATIPPGESREVELTDAQQAELDAERAQAAQDAHAQALAELRLERNDLLATTDWMVSHPADLPPGLNGALGQNRQAWLAYRQALRDLPATTTDPTAPNWPTPPSSPQLARRPQGKHRT